MAKYSLEKDGRRKLTPNLKVSDFLMLDTYVGCKNPANGKKLTAAALAVMDEVVVDDKLTALIRDLEGFYADHYGMPCVIKLTPHGGYRPSKPIDLNGAVGGARGSTHRSGKGADILVTVGGKPLDVPTGAVLAEGFMHKQGKPGGVGVYAAGNKHFHIDVRGSWSAWYCSYSGAGTPAQGGRPCVFKQGNKAAGIVLIQRKLNKLGFDCGATDGAFGGKTEQALKAYQKSVGLAPDGVFGKETNAKSGVFEW